MNANLYALESQGTPGTETNNTALTNAQTQGKQYSSLTLPEQQTTNNMVNVTFGLLVVLVFIALTAWLVRRFGNFQMSAKGNLKIVAGLHMGARERVVLIQVGEQQLLLGVAPGRIQTLHVLTQPLLTEDALTAPPARFSEKLASVLKGAK